MMLTQMEDLQQKLDHLISALDGHDAGAITTATEELATAAILMQGATIAEGTEHRARALMNQTLAQLQAAAMRVNILKHWTRQRIDRGHVLRGSQPRGMALRY